MLEGMGYKCFVAPAPASLPDTFEPNDSVEDVKVGSNGWSEMTSDKYTKDPERLAVLSSNS